MRFCVVLLGVLLFRRLNHTASDNITIRWASTPYGSVAFEDGDCPAGRALQSHGEIMPDLTDLIMKILRKGESAASIGEKTSQ